MEEVRQLVEGLLDNITEWHYEDSGRGERNSCWSCGAEHGTKGPFKHKKDCELKALMERSQKWLDENP